MKHSLIATRKAGGLHALAFVVCSLAAPLSLAAGAQAPAAQVFLPIKQPEAVDAQWRAHLCALLPQPCDGEALRLYSPRGGAVGDHVVLSDRPLAMARVRRPPGAASWTLQSVQDFSSAADAQDQEGTTRTLAAALYPLAEGRWAAAVLHEQSEGYSGGGASFVRADFVPIDMASKSAQPVFTGIPFSCSKLVRACFSEKDYATSKHCHDESEGSLRIAYGKPSQAGAAYDWQFTWLQSDWAANQAPSATVRIRQRFTGSATGSADFCGGPQ